MAFGLTPAGTLTKQATGITSTRRIGVKASTNVSKGNVVFVDTTGRATVASSADEGNFYVALEPANNTAGGDFAISVPLAAGGHFVTVVANGAIKPGNRVKIGTSAGTVAAVVSSEAEYKVVGTYWGKESGLVVKSSTSADSYAETFTDVADFIPTDAATADIIEIELRK